MTTTPKGAVPFRDLPVGPYLVFDRDDHANYVETGGGTPVHWCLCERTSPLTDDKIVIDWYGKHRAEFPAAKGWTGDRYWLFPIQSLIADQMFMRIVAGITNEKWHQLCDETTGTTTLC